MNPKEAERISREILCDSFIFIEGQKKKEDKEWKKK